MKTIVNSYEIKEVTNFLRAMNFSDADIEEIAECEENDPNHTLLLFITDNGSTISVTPSDTDFYFYILNNETDEDIISSTMKDIENFVQNGSLVEL